MLTIAVGHSEDPDTEEALIDLLKQCSDNLKGAQPSAGILFSAVDFEHDVLLNGILDKWPDLELIGCTTDGEVSSEVGFSDDSVILTLFASDAIEIKVAVGRNLSHDIDMACSAAIHEVKNLSEFPPTLCISMPESLTTSATKTVACLEKHLGGVPLIGANAADQWNFKKTFQFYGREVVSDTVPVLMFFGPLKYSYGVASGWKPVGESGVVTRSEANVVYEIDSLPALSFYRRFLGDRATPTGDRPLAVLDGNSIKYLRASIEDYDPETGAITFFGDIPLGAKVQITIADNDSILNGAGDAVDQALKKYPGRGSPDGALIFSCSARKMLLGTKIGEEQTVIFNKLENHIPYAGFYGYGEIADEEFHNETCVVALLGE